MVTIVLAALLAVLGAAAVLAYVRQANNRAVAGLKTESVYTASGSISAGTTLAEAQAQHLLTTQPYPVGSLPAEALRSVAGRDRTLVLLGPVAKGQILTQSMLGTTADVVASGGIVIPAGMEAVTIQVCLSEDVAGYPAVGDYISLFDTYLTSPPKGSKASSGILQRTCDVGHPGFAPGQANTRIVLTKAKVIAVGQAPASQGSSSGIASTVASGAAGQSNGPVLVTLGLDQADTERVINLAEVGLPYMALLSSTATPTFDPNTQLQLIRTP